MMVKRAYYLYQNIISQLTGGSYDVPYKQKIFGAAEGNDIISQLLTADEPFMVSRFGSTELAIIYHYERFKYKKRIFWKADIIKDLQEGGGVFPPTEAILKEFSKLYLDCAGDVDLLGVWFKPGENVITNGFCKKARLTKLEGLEPYYFDNPWSRLLEDKRVLVIHPFEESIKYQYNNKRALLFPDRNILPPFVLSTIKATQSFAYNQTPFEDWFQALEFMYKQINEVDFDVAIIGAGAYGLPLASYIKRKGKKAIHLGGATQVLFGIKGRRWDERSEISALYNDNWKRPYPSEYPQSAEIVEEGCYW
ncbi:hypothetical protein [Segetibacter aerophilus]|uniref:Uncharacterized protein n=1 Tax=Segetibacter aerophilus TaxID=670293 RepID=A0A512B6M6_9BACT|nr:hypothetical protein [Segetibacter aerophilus]GEO07609.1 hypothetical protein SAE01_01050 [Segetibacter aerophilus]